MNTTADGRARLEIIAIVDGDAAIEKQMPLQWNYNFEGEIGRALNSATPTQGTAAGLVSTTLTLSDNTRITFRDLTGVDGRFFR